MKMGTHFKGKEKQLNQKKKKKKKTPTTNENFSLFKANTSLPPGGGTMDGILSGSKCWFTMKPINQSQKHCIANATMSLFFSACQVVFWDFTFVLNGKTESLVSPIFPIYCHHLWGGRHSWSRSVRLTIGFYLGEGFCFVLVFVLWGGILDRVPKHPFLSSHYDLWVWEKKISHFPPSLHLSHMWLPGSARRPQSGHGVFPPRPPWNTGETPKYLGLCSMNYQHWHKL